MSMGGVDFDSVRCDWSYYTLTWRWRCPASLGMLITLLALLCEVARQSATDKYQLPNEKSHAAMFCPEQGDLPLIRVVRV